jgi:hypothetical protein
MDVIELEHRTLLVDLGERLLQGGREGIAHDDHRPGPALADRVMTTTDPGLRSLRSLTGS